VVNGKSVIEILEFADYDSLEESGRDFAWLITHGVPYHAPWECYQGDHELHGLISAVASTYATAPSYADLATAIASQGNVIQAIAQSRQQQHLADVS